MSDNNRFLEAYGVKVVEHEKLDVPSKPERIKEAAGYVHRGILYALENLGGGQWALVVSNKENKEKFERHPLDSKMLGSVLDSLKAVDFDNWNLAKSSMAKLQFKQLGVVEPVAPKEEEPKEEGSKKKFEAKKVVASVEGKTRSGKDIYSNYDHPSHAEFSKEDHEDASKLFRNRFSVKKGRRENEINHHQSTMHYHAGNQKVKKESKNEDEGEDFKKFSELKDKIKRYEEAKMGCEMTGKMNKARAYQKEIDSMTKEMNALEKKMNNDSDASAKQKGLDDGYSYNLDFSDEAKTLQKLKAMSSSNNFYTNTIGKIIKAADKGKPVVVQVKDYSTAYKGGILYATIGDDEFQLSKKNVKLADINLFLPV